MTKKIKTKAVLPPLASVGSLLAKAWVDYKKNIWQMLALMLVAPLLFIILALIIVGLMFVSAGIKPLLIFLALVALVLLIAGIYVGCVCQTALYVVAKENRALSFREVKELGMMHVNKFFITSLWAGIFILLWALLLIVPGIIMSVFYSLALWVYFYEGVSGRAALKRSKELVKGYGWDVAGRLFIVFVLPYIILSILFPASPNSKEANPGIGISNLISLMFAPFAILYVKHLYLSIVAVKK